MNVELINEIIAKALSHEATDQEMEQLQDWLNQSEVNRQQFDHIKYEWHLAQNSNNVIVNGEELKDKIWNLGHSQNRKPTKHRKSGYLHLRIAASFAILITFGTLTWFFANEFNSTIENNQAQIIIKSTTAGQKSKIFLPDGTEVWLNAKSKLSYFENFSDSIRVVHLQGEAFFDVNKEPDRPFIVESHGILTEAIGTSFNIDAYDKNVEVALVEGKVEIKSTSGHVSEILLNPGQMAQYNDIDSAFNLTGFSAVETISWKEGILYFKDASFNEITERLKLWYGIEIELSGRKPPAKHYTGKFNNESLKNVMENISFALDFQYELSGKQLKIKFI
jgi:ferric-dicitrate binding protein FerR (iron transport regulator)